VIENKKKREIMELKEIFT